VLSLPHIGVQFSFELPVVDVICGKSGRKEVEHLKRSVDEFLDCSCVDTGSTAHTFSYPLALKLTVYPV
jgi:hypothetical protein